VELEATTLAGYRKGRDLELARNTLVIGVRHVGLSARDPAALAQFYHDGMISLARASVASTGVSNGSWNPCRRYANVTILRTWINCSHHSGKITARHRGRWFIPTSSKGIRHWDTLETRVGVSAECR